MAFVIDGPYAETQEVLAGFWWVECESFDRATEIAACWQGCPAPPVAYTDIRPIMESADETGSPAAKPATCCAAEIARAFPVSEATTTRRITRAKQITLLYERLLALGDHTISPHSLRWCGCLRLRCVRSETGGRCRGFRIVVGSGSVISEFGEARQLGTTHTAAAGAGRAAGARRGTGRMR
ncbi:hypothetical protein GCM10027089_30610 [Nocardia thraciensis]